MITKGIIKSIDLLGNTCTVHIPFFETAGNDPIIETATVSNTPGSYNGYKVGDVVYVAFEDGSMSTPVVIGKLYLGTEKEKADPRGVSNVEESTAAKKATLPADSKLTAEIDSNVPNTTVPYSSLSSIANGLNTLNTNVGQMDRDYGNRFKQVISNAEGLKSEIEQTAENVVAKVSGYKQEVDTKGNPVYDENGQPKWELNDKGERIPTEFGWDLQAESWSVFNEDKTILTADKDGLHIAGIIDAESGHIGKFNIGAEHECSELGTNASGIYSDDYIDKYEAIPSTEGIYVGTDGIRLGKNFSVNTKGKLTTKSLAVVNGNNDEVLTADTDTVKISGFTVEDKKLHYYNPDYEYDYGGTIYKGTGVGIGAVPNEGSWAFWAGKQSGNGVEKTNANDTVNNAYGWDAPFKVGHDGALFATRGEIGGFSINTNSLHSNNYISSFNDTPVDNSTTTTIDESNGIYLGTDGIKLGTNFSVDTTGSLTAKSLAVVNGDGKRVLTADTDTGDVKISGFTVEDSKLYYYGTDKNDSTKKVGAGIGGIPYGGSWAFWAGEQTGNGIEKTSSNDKVNGPYGQDAPFRVGHDGALFATRGEIGNWEIGNGGAGSPILFKKTFQNSKPLHSVGMAGLDSPNHVAFWAGCPGGMTPWEYNAAVKANPTAYNDQNNDYGKVTPFFVTSLGYLNATSGKIGCADFIDNKAISIKKDGIEQYKLEPSGISFADGATLSLGAVSFVANQSEAVTYANGTYVIKNIDNNGSTISAITLGGERGGDEFEYTITLKLQGTGSYFSAESKVWAEASSKVLQQVIIKYRYGIASWALNYGTSEEQILTINPGKTKSNVHTWTATYDVINRYMRVVASAQGNTVGGQAGYSTNEVNMSSAGNAINIWSTKIKQKKATNNIAITGNLIPAGQGYNLGAQKTGGGWQNLYITGAAYNESGGAVDLSDAEHKNTIEPLSEKYSKLFDELKPVTFKYNRGTSNRLHTGFIAQEVLQATLAANLTTSDFAAYCEWEPDDGGKSCGLRYSEFIPLNTDQIQKLKKQVAAQEVRIAALEEIIENLKTE